jgi:hypothetical protein
MECWNIGILGGWVLTFGLWSLRLEEDFALRD